MIDNCSIGENEMKKVKKYWFLILLIIIFIIKGVFYAKDIIPATTGQAPDEVGHVSYIQYIAGEKKLPVLNETNMEKETILLYCKYVFEHYPDIEYMDFKNDTYNFEFSTSVNWIAQHPPLYYICAAPVYALSTLFFDSLVHSIIMVRMLSVIFGVLFLIVVYNIGKCVGLRDVVLNSLLTFLVFWPQIQYYFATTSCDSLLTLLCALTLLVLIKYVQTDKKKYFYLFVICCAAVVLTKYTGALVLIPYICYYVWQNIKKHGLKDTVIDSLKAGILGLVLIAPVFIRNYMLYDNPLAVYVQESAENSPITNFGIFIFDYEYFDELFSVLSLLIGWRNFLYPIDLFKLFILGLVIIAMIGYIPNKNWKSILGVNALLIVGAYGFMKLFSVEYASSLFFVAIILILSYIIYDFIKNKESDFDLFVAGTLIFVFFFFLFQQYEFSSRLGSLRTVHGRYYMIATVPMLYLIVNGIQKTIDKVHNRAIVKVAIPVLIAIIMIAFEMDVITSCLNIWFD